MKDLHTQHCTACSSGELPMDLSQIQEQLKCLPNWQLDSTQTSISRRFEFKGFNKIIMFINALAWIVNQEGHHPTVEFGYNYCCVRFTTHAIDGLSKNDFICAAKVDALLQ